MKFKLLIVILCSAYSMAFAQTQPKKAIIKGSISLALIGANGGGPILPLNHWMKESKELNAGQFEIDFAPSWFVENCEIQDQTGCRIAYATKTVEITEVKLFPSSPMIKLPKPLIFEIELGRIQSGHLVDQTVRAWIGQKASKIKTFAGQGASVNRTVESGNSSFYESLVSFGGDAIPVKLTEVKWAVGIVPSLTVSEINYQ